MAQIITGPDLFVLQHEPFRDSGNTESIDLCVMAIFTYSGCVCVIFYGKYFQVR